MRMLHTYWVTAVMLVSGVYGAIGSLFTIYGTGDPGTSAGFTVYADSTDSAYFGSDSVYVGSGASLTTWGPEALGGTGVGGDGDVALPVELTAFSARLSGTGVLLSWQTASETDHLGFNVLRSSSADGDFACINPVLIPGSGSAAGKAYTYTDTDTDPETGTMYYKLQAVDTKGGTDESGVITVTYTPAGVTGVPPQLTNAGLRQGIISLAGLQTLFADGKGMYRLFDASGMPVNIAAVSAVPAVYIVERATAGMVTCFSVLVVTQIR